MQFIGPTINRNGVMGKLKWLILKSPIKLNLNEFKYSTGEILL